MYVLLVAVGTAANLESINVIITPVLRNSNQEPGTEGVVGQDEIPVLEDGNVIITPKLKGDVAEVAAVTTSVANDIVAFTWSQNLLLAMVDAPEMPSNIGASLEDVVGTVLFHLIAIARDVSARDALELLGPSRRSRHYSNLHRDAFYMVTPLANVVALVT